MRRLPIFFLADVSESMVGENLRQLEHSIRSIASRLCKDPYALETAFLSVIVFAGKPMTIVQLTELFDFHLPELPVGGGTALGKALNHLMDEIDRTVVKTSMERKGDWKPVIFLLTDGHPTDNASQAIRRWNSGYRSKSNLVAISIGGGADSNHLEQLTNDVIIFNDTATDAFNRFVSWVSQSIENQSRSACTGQGNKIFLSEYEPDLLASSRDLSQIAPFSNIDDRFAVFTGRCVKSSLPYVVKYECKMDRTGRKESSLANQSGARNYELVAVVPVKDSFFDLSNGFKSDQLVKSKNLVGIPSCPHCESGSGFAKCNCGGIHCGSSWGMHTCPWCQAKGLYVPWSFGIKRGMG